MNRKFAVLLSCALVCLVALPAQAQFGSTGTSSFGRSSGMGGLGSGMSGFGGMNSGMGGFGSGMSGLGGMGSGMGGFGSGMSGFGGMNSGMGGFGNSFGNSGFGNSFGNSGMGGGMGGGQAFIGRDSADMASTFSQMGQAAQAFNQMNRNSRRSNNSSRGNSTAKVSNAPQPMLVNLRVAFDPGRPSANQLESTIRTRLGATLASQNIAMPEMFMEGDVVVLRGVAATESQSMVMEQLLAFEPGVGGVRNEMTIAPLLAPTATE